MRDVVQLQASASPAKPLCLKPSLQQGALARSCNASRCFRMLSLPHLSGATPKQPQATRPRSRPFQLDLISGLQKPHRQPPLVLHPLGHFLLDRLLALLTQVFDNHQDRFVLDPEIAFLVVAFPLFSIASALRRAASIEEDNSQFL